MKKNSLFFRSYGKYQKQISAAFLIVAVMFFCLFAAAQVLIINTTIKNQYTQIIRRTSATNTMLAKTQLTAVHTALNMLFADSSVKQWEISTAQGDYYFDAYIIKRLLATISEQFSMTTFVPSLTRLEKDVFVITPTGTFSKQEFFKSETLLTKEQSDAVLDYFKTNTGSLNVPAYGSDKQLKEVYMFVRRNFIASDMLYIMRIPRESLVDKDLRTFALRDSSGVFAYSSLENNVIDLFSSALAKLPNLPAVTPEEKSVSVQVRDSIVFNEYISNTWSFLYAYNSPQMSALQILLYIAAPLLFFTALLFFLYRFTTRWLYAPVHNLMASIAASAKESSVHDEFLLLKENIERSAKTSADLNDAVSKNKKLVLQHLYHDLISGISVRSNEMYRGLISNTLPFCAAVIEIQDVDEFSTPAVLQFKKTVSDMCAIFVSAQYVNVDLTRCAVIFQDDVIENVSNILIRLYNTIPLHFEIHIAVSSIRIGMENIHGCFDEALRVLENAHAYTDKHILFANDFFDVPTGSYFYPLIFENRFIQSLVRGSSASLDLFDEIIEENFKKRTLSYDQQHNLIVALANSVQRVFQEIHIAPESVQGAEILSGGIMQIKVPPQCALKLRMIIEELLLRIADKNNDANSVQLHKMKSYIYANYSRDISLDDMAHELNISAKYCSNLFKKLSSSTFKDYLNQYRIERAKEFIENDPQIKVSDLCMKVGFNSSNTFIRVFNKYTGMTPKAYAGIAVRN